MENTDIGLYTAVHKVQTVAAIGSFQVYIHCSCHILAGLQAVGNAFRFRIAGKVQNLAVALIHTQLVGSTCHRIFHNACISGRLAGLRLGCNRLGHFRLCALAGSIKTDRILAFIHISCVIAGDIRGIGNTDIGIGTEGTHIISVVSVIIINKGICSLIIGQDFTGSCSYKLQATLTVTGVAVLTVIDADIGFHAALLKEQTITAVSCLQFHIHCICSIGACCQAEGSIVSVSGEIIHRTTNVHTQLISRAYFRLSHICRCLCCIGWNGHASKKAEHHNHCQQNR